MANSTASTSKKEKLPPKAKKWQKKIKWLLFLTLVAFLINGPIARWGVKRALHKSLSEQGLNGSVLVTGTLRSGFTISDLAYSGTSGIHSIHINSATIKYSILDLFDSKLKSISVKGIRATIDIAKFQSTKKHSSKKTWQAQLKLIRPWLINPDLSAEDLKITVLKDSHFLMDCQLASLQHSSGSDSFIFHNWKIHDSAGNSTPKQITSIIWKPHQAQIDHIELLPNISLNDLSLHWSPTSDLPTGNARLSLWGSSADLNIDDKITLTHTAGEIDSLLVTQQFNIQSPFQLTLSDYHISIDDYLNTPIPSWQISSNFKIKEGTIQNHPFRDATISFNQKKLSYIANIDAVALDSILDLTLDGKWTQPHNKRWWQNSTFTLNATAKELNTAARHFTNLPPEIDLSKAEFSTSTNGELIDGALKKSDFTIVLNHLKASTTPLPDIFVSGSYLPSKIINTNLKIQRPDAKEPSISAKLKYHIDTKSYTAELHSDESEPHWMNALLHAYNQPYTLTKNTKINWIGNGNHNTHSGKLSVKKLSIKPAKNAAIEIQSSASYQWPSQLNIQSFHAKQEELTTRGSLHWDGNTITIPHLTLNRYNLPIIKLSGSIPYNNSITSLEAFLRQNKTWHLSLHTDKLNLSRLVKTLPSSLPKTLTGILQTDIEITGSPITPTLKGNVSLHNVAGIADHELQPLNLKLNLASKQRVIQLNALLLEGQTQRLISNIKLPFNPHLWLKQKNLLDFIQQQNISGTASIKELPLNRFKPLLPQLKKIEGRLTADARFTGTITQPKYTINFHADLPILTPNSKILGNIKELQLKGTFDQSQHLHAKLTAQINGGDFKADIFVDTTNTQEPKWDIQLITDHALVYRDDALTSRVNANLRLLGTPTNSTISGNLNIVESLFYKEIELIPIGVPSSAVHPIQLPSLNKTNSSLPIPAPYDKWLLDLHVRTVDPILLRGNLANGTIKGALTVAGTLGKPKLNGSLDLLDLRAQLPFSELKVKHGKISFSPQNGFIPQLQIRGTSNIGNYHTDLYIYGSADAPKTSFSSLPPLPENEIMTLLATGTTTAKLENKDVTTFKALQILLRKLSENKQTPHGNRLFKTLLKTMSEMNLNIGEVDEFTGRQYSSVSYKIHRRWYLTAQLDNEQKTRGLIVYIIRFK